MQAVIQPSQILGSITAPTSKSSMQRACAAALIKRGKTTLYNPGASADDLAALDIIRQLGASVIARGETLLIESTGIAPKTGSIHCGESGLSVRMFTPIAALSDQKIHITGSGSLVTRPLSFFDEILPKVQVTCESNNGFLPLTVKGPLQPGNITLDGSLSSQFLTGILMAYAASSASDITVNVTNLASKPYIDLTLKVMQEFGLPVPINNEYKSFYFPGEPEPAKKHEELSYTVEGDWSGGAFLLVAGAIAGSLEVKGLDVFSSQADKAILQALMQAGVSMSVEAQKIGVRQSLLKAFHFNATDCPDLFPPLVALASYCEGKTVIEGVRRLAHKESNRALTLQEEFGKLGVAIQLQDDVMIIDGGKRLTGGTVSSHSDHRIAMACAIAALQASATIYIKGAEAVNKSYPQFWQHLSSIGATVSLKD
ncbi:MAG: 3-phosphoshikimate 1-carboxyvinyltransferase [Flaviaesturariibacter sp.]|nr:3-phosphoshikimate 1-carboxyvinyltransferase [Flaviaesturariibacter sp.]